MVGMKVPKRRRRPRASVQDIYSHCRVFGNCPTDVKNKVEQNTLADKILKWGSLGTFFGGLGIGTGSGTGGKTGYVPLGSGSSAAAEAGLRPPPVRPPPIPEVSLPDITVDIAPTVSASDPSIIPMVELSTPSIEVIAESVPQAPGAGVGDSSIITSDTGPAVLDPRPSGRLRSSTTQFQNPVYHNTHTQTTSVGESSFSGGTLISHGQDLPSVGEQIELQTFRTTLDGGGEPTTSTPLHEVIRGRTAIRPFARGTQQVAVEDPLFLSRPYELVQYDNPAFEGDPDETILFENPSIHEAPDPAFMDIIALHRPALSTTRRGLVRVSRIGNRATIRTRSGAQIGGRVHYYHDITPIAPEASIEMSVLSGPLVEPLGSGVEETLFDVYSDVDAIPGYGETAVVEDDFTFNADTSAMEDSFPFPAHMPSQIPVSLPTSTHVLPRGGLTLVSPPPDSSQPPTDSGGGWGPAALFWSGSDFYLHPSLLLRRRRKKKYYL